MQHVVGDIRHIQRINKWKPDQVGAFEVFVDDFGTLSSIGDQVYKETGSTLDSKTIIEKYSYIFNGCSCLTLIY
jgi:lipoprotein-releasing system permease protein